jgi:transcriptional regulator with XRE-family HTH domain
MYNLTRYKMIVNNLILYKELHKMSEDFNKCCEKSTSYYTIIRILLRELRIERKVHQAQICQLLGITGITGSTWSKVESGEIQLTLEHVLTACFACHVLPSELFQTAQNYQNLLCNHGWYVAAHGSALPKEEDKLSIDANAYYSFIYKNSFKRSWLPCYEVLQTPWPSFNTCAPLDVFRWILDPVWRNQQENSLQNQQEDIF